jgi:hypothetical protein
MADEVGRGVARNDDLAGGIEVRESRLRLLRGERRAGEERNQYASDFFECIHLKPHPSSFHEVPTAKSIPERLAGF